MKPNKTSAAFSPEEEQYRVTENGCKLCTPLGACLVFKGLKKAVPFLHGSQGCATYIRRYMISHFKEPVDIASSNFSESSAVFGGENNLSRGLNNIISQYAPDTIGIMTTCLSETIGDDVTLLLKNYRQSFPKISLPSLPHLIPVSTPSYRGTHADGFREAVHAVVKHFSGKREDCEKRINLFPGMLSPADLRYFKEVLSDYRQAYTLLPDYSETLDGPLWEEYHTIPSGGTPLDDLLKFTSACGTIELGHSLTSFATAGTFLEKSYGIPLYQLGFPIGVKENDSFFSVLKTLTGQSLLPKYRQERERLLDAYADGHKYLFEKKVAIIGEEDMVIALAAFVSEIGMIPKICASGGKSGILADKLKRIIPEAEPLSISISDNADYNEIEQLIRSSSVDIVLGSSKAYTLCRRQGLPLVRVGFPIHDRLGGQRLLSVGYRGTMQFFDRIVNALIAKEQEESPVGYTYM